MVCLRDGISVFPGLGTFGSREGSGSMTGKSLLLICRGPRTARSIARLLDPTMRAGLRMVKTVESAMALPELPDFGVVLVFIKASERLDEPDLLVRTLSAEDKSVPVIMLSPSYDESQALMAFELGVTDYLGLHEHSDVVASVVGATLRARQAPLGGRGAQRSGGSPNLAGTRVALKRSGSH